MKTFIKLLDITTVQYSTMGFTDILSVSYTMGRRRTWTVEHYEERPSQQRRREQLRQAYKDIKDSLAAGKTYVEIEIDD